MTTSSEKDDDPPPAALQNKFANNRPAAPDSDSHLQMGSNDGNFQSIVRS
jgi:hypothetical protein